jgi:hypothetical protein
MQPDSVLRMFFARVCAVSCLCLLGWSGQILSGAEVTSGENAAMWVRPEFKVSPVRPASVLLDGAGKPANPVLLPQRRDFFTIFGAEFSLAKGMGARTPGPDGRLYFFCADGGASIQRSEGGVVHVPEEGAVLRCEPDGRHLEVFCRGLRDVRGLAFDNAGNLFTADTGAGSGDDGRWLYLLEHGDYGWRIGWLQSALGPARNPWVAEKLWAARFEGQAAWILPPVMNVGTGAWTVTHYPGLGFDARYDDHFFAANAGLRAIFTLAMRPNGAGFLRMDQQKIVENAPVEGFRFGSKAELRFWTRDSSGVKTFSLTPAVEVLDPQVDFAARLLDEELELKTSVELQQFLKYPDQRVRLYAEWKLAVSPDGEILLRDTALSPNGGREPSIARLHGIWGLGILARRVEEKTPGAGVKILDPLVPLLEDEDPEVRAQAAGVLGDLGVGAAFDGLIKVLRSPEERTSMFAAEALAKLGRPETFAQLVLMIREAGDHDPNLRHAYVDALLGLRDDDAIKKAARHDAATVRMAAILAMRRLKRADLAQFLEDDEPALLLEAARAIHDESVTDALPMLAALIEKPTANEALMVRVLNANFRAGQPANASALATFAAREDVAEALRIDALNLLATWPHPPTIDYVTGAAQTLAGRDAAPAREALAAVLPRLQTVKSPDFAAAVAAATKALQSDAK